MPNPQDALRAEIAAQQAKLDSLTAQLLALTTVQDENDALRAEIASLNTTIAQLTEERDAAVQALEDYKASHPDPQEPPADDQTDWATLSAGALVARRLMVNDPSDIDLSARHRLGNDLDTCLWVPDENTYTKPVLDDAKGLRFDIEPNKGAADVVIKIPPMGANSKLRARWVFEANSAFVDTVFRMADGGYPGIKMAIFATLAASSPSNKFVLTCIDQHKFLGGYRYSYATGATENFEPAVGDPVVDYDWQPRQGQPATCLYSVVNKTPQGVAVPGCDTLVANQNIVLEMEMDTGGVIAGTNGTAWDCEYRCYMTVGDGPRKLVFDYGKTTRGYQGRRAEAWTAIWLVPFMTGRDLTQTFPSTPSVWFRDLIVKGEPTAAEPVPVPDPTPAPTPDPIPTTGPLPVFTPTRDASGNVTNYGALPLRQWHEIAGTKMNQLKPQLPQSNDSDLNNVMANWGSAAQDHATGDMHLHGGAHGANGENSGWYTFNTKRADWRITVPPLYMGMVEKAYLDKCAKLYYPNDPAAAYNGSWNMGMPPEFLFLPELGSVTGDPTLANPNATSSGKVFAHHCWHKLVWVEWMQRAFVSLMHFYFLDPTTGKIEVKQKHNDTDWQYNTADPVTKRIYGFTRIQYYEYWDFREYDPIADSALVNYPLGQLYAADGTTKLDKAKYSFSQSNMQVVVGREIVFYNPISKVWYAFHMDTKAWRALMWQPLPFVSGAGDYAGVYYGGRIICCQGWGKLYEVDPNTGAVAPFAVTGPDTFGNTTVNNGLFGRLNLDGNLLLALDWATSNAKVMRLP